MDNEDVIRNQMEDTRTSLTDKLETLEKQVVDTVQDATSNVAETVAAVKDSVQDTVTSVKDTVQETFSAVKESMRQSVNAVKGVFDIPEHVDRHPWAMMGGSVVLGYVLGAVLRGSGATRHSFSSLRSPQPASSRSSSNGRHEDTGPQSSEGLLTKLAPEISKLKGLALGAVVGAVREMIQNAVPPDLASSLNEIFTSITEKVTGAPSHGSRSRQVSCSD
jgi:ElaB/YqjD/DUF883 family membrane-anchored ribosome-binding protein